MRHTSTSSGPYIHSGLFSDFFRRPSDQTEEAEHEDDGEFHGGILQPASKNAKFRGLILLAGIAWFLTIDYRK